MSFLVRQLARIVARWRPLGPGAGHSPALDSGRTDPWVRLRGALWTHCKTHRVPTPIVIRWQAGLRLRLFLGNEKSRALFVNGCPGGNRLALLDRHLCPGMVVVDAGAGDGLMTLFAARRVGRSGVVLAVEPSTREIARLVAHLGLNGLTNVRVRPFALSRQNGLGVLHVADDQHEDHNSLAASAHAGTTGWRREHVPVVRLDDLVSRERLDRVDLVSIDVEGEDLAVLEGARWVLSTWKPLLLLRLCKEAALSPGNGPGDLVVALRTFGYRPVAIEEATGRPSSDGEHEVGFFDFVAAHANGSSEGSGD